MNDMQVEWKGRRNKYRLYGMENPTTKRPCYGVEYQMDEGHWELDHFVSLHEVDCLEACAYVPNLHPMMLAEAVELLERLEKCLICEPGMILEGDEIAKTLGAFLSQIDGKPDSEVRNG